MRQQQSSDQQQNSRQNDQQNGRLAGRLARRVLHAYVREQSARLERITRRETIAEVRAALAALRGE